MAIEAVISISGPDWGTHTVYRGSPPFGVIFRADSSTSDVPIKKYEWDFDDGNTDEGYIVAHVFTELKTHTVTLTVTDEENNTDSTTTTVEIIPPTNGNVYFDSVNGDDSNDGLSAETAWQTGDKLKTFLENPSQVTSRNINIAAGSVLSIPPGIKPVTGSGNIHFLKYGEGLDPVLRRKSGTSNTPLFHLTNGDTGRYSFQEVVLDGTSEDNIVGNIWEQTGRAFNITFYKCTFLNAYQSIIFNRPGFEIGAANSIFGIFCKQCHFDNSANIHMHFRAKGIAILDCLVENAGNHGTYCAWAQEALFHRNTYQGCWAERTCLRVSGASNQDSFDYPSKWISIKNNTINGSFDGSMWQSYCIEIQPNTNTHKQSIEEVEILNNTVTEGRTLLTIGSAENVLVEGNTFISEEDDSPVSPRISISERFNMRPVKNITIKNNTIKSNGNRTSGVGRTIAFYKADEERPGPDSSTYNKGISVVGNDITILNKVEWGLFYQTDHLEEITTRNYWTGVDRTVNKVITDTINSYSLDEWFALTGNEEAYLDDPPDDPGETPVEFNPTARAYTSYGLLKTELNLPNPSDVREGVDRGDGTLGTLKVSRGRRVYTF